MDPQLQALQQQLQQQAAQIVALQQALQAPQVHVAGPFALTPALAQLNVINMMTTAGIKLYKAIVTALVTPFDGSLSKLQAFLDEVRQRASDSGWTANLLSISNQDPVNPVSYNLILHHQMLTLDNVCAHAATYVGQQTRLAQDSFMMYEFLRNSLTDSARIRLSVESDKFEINNIQDGPSYLKVLLIKFYV
jgi:hypothetical protein